MKDRVLYAGIAVLALTAGATFWALDAPSGAPRPAAATIGPTALYAATYTAANGETVPLGRYQGRVLLINFWATWCAPCREEMPALSAAAQRWAARGVTIVGVSNETREAVADFAGASGLAYPLGTAGPAADELARRLGDQAGVLPYSAVLNAQGRVVSQKVGPYTAAELDRALSAAVANAG